jgi:hypothetical protein
VDVKKNSEPEASLAASVEPQNHGLSWMVKAGIVVGLFGASLLSTLIFRVFLLATSYTPDPPDHLFGSKRVDFGLVLLSVLFGQVIFGLLAYAISFIADLIGNSMRRLKSKALVTALKIISAILHIFYVLIGLLCAPFLLLRCFTMGFKDLFEYGKYYLLDLWADIYDFKVEEESVEQ